MTKRKSRKNPEFGRGEFQIFSKSSPQRGLTQYMIAMIQEYNMCRKKTIPQFLRQLARIGPNIAVANAEQLYEAQCLRLRLRVFYLYERSLIWKGISDLFSKYKLLLLWQRTATFLSCLPEGCIIIQKFVLKVDRSGLCSIKHCYVINSIWELKTNVTKKIKSSTLCILVT